MTMMKHLAASALILLAPAMLLAQTTASGSTGDAAPAKKAAAAPKKAHAKPSASRVEIKSTAKNMAAGINAAEAALTPAELAIAQRVYIGRLPCELGAYVTLEADPKTPGYFNVQTGKVKYRMSPVESRTGAIRLEDQAAGAVWLQLANKSMLMNHKLGQRLADECMSPEQLAVAEALKKNPAPSLLEPLPGTATATAPAAGASAAK